MINCAKGRLESTISEASDAELLRKIGPHGLNPLGEPKNDEFFGVLRCLTFETALAIAAVVHSRVHAVGPEIWNDQSEVVGEDFDVSIALYAT